MVGKEILEKAFEEGYKLFQIRYYDHYDSAVCGHIVAKDIEEAMIALKEAYAIDKDKAEELDYGYEWALCECCESDECEDCENYYEGVELREIDWCHVDEALFNVITGETYTWIRWNGETLKVDNWHESTVKLIELIDALRGDAQ